MFEPLFNHNWWLLFPLSFAVFGVMRTVLRNEESRRILSLIRSYADQGKEPPAELIALLKR